MAEVRLRGVRKCFGRFTAIHDVDLDVRDGELMVFVGPSGCGKSTLLRLIAGLEDVTAGDIVIDGERVTDRPPSRRGIAMVFQSYALYPHMTVYDNMAFGLKLARTGRKAVEERVRAAARTLQIEGLLDRRPRELSGGQRQRVAIGRAIVREPKVFLFDEPLSNLDAGLRVQMRLEIARLKEELGATMVYVTHDQVEAMTLATRIAVLRGGRVEQVGTPLDLYARPANRFVASFIGSPAMNFLEAEVVDVPQTSSVTLLLPGGDELTARAESPPGPPCAMPGSHLTLGIRPEHFVPPDEADAVIEGRVFAVERLGVETYCHVRLPAEEGTEAEKDGDAEAGDSIVVRLSGDAPVRVGDAARLGISAPTVHLFNAEGVALPRLGV